MKTCDDDYDGCDVDDGGQKTGRWCCCDGDDGVLRFHNVESHNTVIYLDAEKARQCVRETPLRRSRRLYDRQRWGLMKRRVEAEDKEQYYEDGDEDEGMDVEMDYLDVNVDVDDNVHNEFEEDEGEEEEHKEDDDCGSMNLGVAAAAASEAGLQ